jgi:isohexenylglutaconyl-CoA hydratase
MTQLPSLTDVTAEPRQSTLFVTLNRPQARNAITGAMVESLMALADWLDTNRDIRFVVLRGAGGAFCGGGDIREFGRMLMTPEPAPGAPDPIAIGNRVFGDLLLKLDALPQVVIAVVEGAAFGGANGFIAVSDIAIAEANTKFSLSETTLGVPPAQIGPFMARKVGLYNARRLALSGAHFTADEARRIGLVDRVADGAGAVEAALIETLNAVGRCEPEANAATKRILNASAAPIDPAVLDKAAEEFAACLRGRGREGAAAFAQKTAPPWVEAYTERLEI